MRLLPCLLAVGLIFGLSACSFVRAAEGEKDKEKQVAAKDIPKAVQKAVKKLFPGAEVLRATKEEEGDDEEVYEIEIELNKQRIDVTVDEEGEVESFEPVLFTMRCGSVVGVFFGGDEMRGPWSSRTAPLPPVPSVNSWSAAR
jgi:hypothetical protein